MTVVDRGILYMTSLGNRNFVVIHATGTRNEVETIGTHEGTVYTGEADQDGEADHLNYVHRRVKYDV